MISLIDAWIGSKFQWQATARVIAGFSSPGLKSGVFWDVDVIEAVRNVISLISGVIHLDHVPGGSIRNDVEKPVRIARKKVCVTGWLIFLSNDQFLLIRGLILRSIRMHVTKIVVAKNLSTSFHPRSPSDHCTCGGSVTAGCFLDVFQIVSGNGGSEVALGFKPSVLVSIGRFKNETKRRRLQLDFRLLTHCVNISKHFLGCATSWPRSKILFDVLGLVSGTGLGLLVDHVKTFDVTLVATRIFVGV